MIVLLLAVPTLAQQFPAFDAERIFMLGDEPEASEPVLTLWLLIS